MSDPVAGGARGREVDAASFEKEVLRSEGPVLVDFRTTWCEPCRQVEPVLEEVAAEYRGLRLLRVDADAEQELAHRFRVETLPTFILFRGGEEVDRMLGAMPKAFFHRFLAGRV